MALVVTPIYTQTVGAGGASQVAFNSIPQVYTDLKLVVSGRASGAAVEAGCSLYVNGLTTSIYSKTVLFGTGSSVGSFRQGAAGAAFNPSVPGSSTTANTFGSAELYVPNYTSSNFKQIVTDWVLENNASSTVMTLGSDLIATTAAISSLTLFCNNGNFVQHSTFSLYGIIRSGA